MFCASFVGRYSTSITWFDFVDFCVAWGWLRISHLRFFRFKSAFPFLPPFYSNFSAFLNNWSNPPYHRLVSPRCALVPQGLAFYWFHFQTSMMPLCLIHLISHTPFVFLEAVMQANVLAAFVWLHCPDKLLWGIWSTLESRLLYSYTISWPTIDFVDIQFFCVRFTRSTSCIFIRAVIMIV